VWFHETERDEERLIRFLLRGLQALDGFIRGGAIGIGVVGDIGGLVGGALGKIGGGLVGEERLLARESGRGLALGERVGDHLGLPVRHTPRSGVLAVAMADVEELAQRLGVPAILLEVLRQGHGVRPGLAEVRAEVVNSESLGAEAGEQRITRGGAHSLVAVGQVEPHAARGEAVRVGRLHRGVSVAAEQRLEVIHADEEDVGFLCRMEDRRKQ
jgi:hypothetical protein